MKKSKERGFKLNKKNVRVLIALITLMVAFILCYRYFSSSGNRVDYIDYASGEKRWDEEMELGNGIVVPYQGKAGDDITYVVYYQIESEGIINIKRVTTIDGVEKVDYLQIRDMHLYDASQLHQVIKNSGREHFGLEPTYDHYGKSQEEVEMRILTIGAKGENRKGIFHSDTLDGEMTYIGYIGHNTLKKNEKVAEDEDKRVEEIYYALGSPEVTGVRGAGSAAAYGYLGSIFHFSTESVDKVVAYVHITNERGQRLVEKMHFTKHGKEYNTRSRGRKRIRRDMVSYSITFDEWVKRDSAVDRGLFYSWLWVFIKTVVMAGGCIFATYCMREYSWVKPAWDWIQAIWGDFSSLV